MSTYYIRGIKQIDNTTLEIAWNDHAVSTFKLSHLQRNCPCAGCVEESTGERRILPETVPEELRAKKISSVGNYAIRIFFNSGCHHGIYTFDYLRSLIPKEQPC